MNQLFYRNILFLIFTLCSSAWLSGQTVNITSTSPDLTTCGASGSFLVDLQNLGGDTLVNSDIFIQLAPGVAYLSGTVSGPGISLSANPAPDSLLLSCDTLMPFQAITLEFQAEATCEATDSLAVFNFIRITHNQGADSVNAAPYSILRPSLAIQSITPSSVTDSLGATFTRCVTVTNGGFGALEDFYVAILADTQALGYANFTLSANGASLTPVFNGDSIRFYFDASHITQQGDLDASFEQNEILEFCYEVTIRTCGSLASEVHAFWGCDGSFCESQFQGANSIVDILPPLLNINTTSIRDRCYGDSMPTVGKIIMQNNGTGPARNVTIRVQVYNGHITSLDTSNVLWVDSAGNAIRLTPNVLQVGTTTGTYSCLGPNRVILFEAIIPEIPAGRTDTLIFGIDDCCKSWCSPSPSFLDRCDYSLSYTGRCDTTLYEIPRTVLIGNNYGRVLSQAVSGPSDLLPGDTATYCIEHSSFRFFNFNGGAFATADIILPPSLSYVNQPGNFYYEDPQGDLWNPTSVQVIGDTVRGIFNLPVSAGVTLEKVDLKIRLIPDCSGGPCSGGPEVVSYNLYETPDTSCSCRALISCLQWDVTTHCGVCNCDDGGMVFRNFEVYRTNLGLPDNDEDGLPDTTGTIDSTGIRMNYVMFGDTLTTRFHGLVDTATVNPFFTQGYATSVIDGGTRLTPITASMDIYDLSTGSVYNCPLGAPVATTIIGDVRQYDYAFDTASLSGFVPPGFLFDEGDSVVLVADYRVSTNIGGAVRTEGLSNYFGLINAATGDSAACDSFGGSYVMVGYYYTNCCFNQFFSSYCNQVTISQNYYLSIGNCCSNYSGGNIFQKEFRHWGTMDQVEIVVPPGYNFVSATLEHRRTRGTQGSATINTPLSAAAIYGDTVLINLDSTWANRGGPIPLGDDGHLGIIRTTFEPNCQASGTQDRVYFIYEWEPIAPLAGPGSAAVVRSAFDSLRSSRTDLALSPILPLVSGISSTVTWEFSITNNFNVFIATNSWFSLMSSSGQIIPLLVEDTATNTVLTPVNGVYQIGDIDPDSVEVFRITAAYTDCDLDSIQVVTGWDCSGFPTASTANRCILDSAYLYVEPQPSDLQANLTMPAGPYDICDSIPVQLELVSSQVADVRNPSIQAVLPLNGGLSYQPGSSQLEYPIGSGFVAVPDPTMVGNQLTWDLNAINALIAANDLPGVLLTDSNSLNLSFTLETNCSFISRDRFLIEVNGDRPCGDPLNPIRLFSAAIDINGVSQPYTTQVSASISENSNCPQNQTVNVALLNTGAGSTNTGDSLFLDLNGGFSFAGNFVGGQNPPFPNNPTVQVFTGGTRLSWPMPPGLVPGDSVTFSFDLDIADSVSCGTELASLSSVVNTNLFCARTGTNCNAGAQTGSFSLSIPISRPDLAFSSFAAARNPVAGGWDYFYNGTLTNNGAPITGGTSTTVNFYCDTDNSGGYSSNDSLLGTYTTTTALPNGGNHAFNGQLFYNNTACAGNQDIFAVILPNPSGGYCLCDTVATNTNVVLPVLWLDFSGEVMAAGNRLQWEASLLPGHSHFELERKNGLDWVGISPEIRGAGSEYSFLDREPGLREFYRVKALDQNGNASYSSVILLEREGPLVVRLYPNPAINQVTLEGPIGTTYQVKDILSQHLMRGQLSNSTNQVDISHLSKGVYLVEFKHQGQSQTLKLVVE